MWSVRETGSVLAVLAVLAAGEPLRCRSARCAYTGERAGEHTYQVDDHHITLAVDLSKLKIACGSSGALQWSAAPRAEPALRVAAVELAACPPAALPAALAALHVVLACRRGAASEPCSELRIHCRPGSAPLAARHLAGLERLARLYVTGGRVERGFLAPLRDLRLLKMSGVELPGDELEPPPPALTELYLEEMSVKRLPEALRWSPALRGLGVASGRALDAGAVPPAARSLELHSPATALRLDATHALETLWVSGWTEPRPAPLASCAALQELTLHSPVLVALPAGWLARCSALTRLAVRAARGLTALPARLLLGARALQHVAIAEAALETLPRGLLDHAPALRELNLQRNRLRTLPSDTFSVPRQITWLDLYSNQLEARSLAALAQLRELGYLDLSDNPRLGAAVCDSALTVHL